MSIKVDQLSEPGEYDDAMLALLQIIWGDGFLSPGGPEEIERLLEGSDISGCHVLDIGCGLGAIDEADGAVVPDKQVIGQHAGGGAAVPIESLDGEQQLMASSH